MPWATAKITKSATRMTANTASQRGFRPAGRAPARPLPAPADAVFPFPVGPLPLPAGPLPLPLAATTPGSLVESLKQR